MNANAGIWPLLSDMSHLLDIGMLSKWPFARHRNVNIFMMRHSSVFMMLTTGDDDVNPRGVPRLLAPPVRSPQKRITPPFFFDP